MASGGAPLNSGPCQSNTSGMLLARTSEDRVVVPSS